MNKPKHNCFFKCETCGVEVSRYQPPYRGTPRFCSPSCMGKSGKGKHQSADHVSKRIKSGDNHPNWIGDSVSEKSGRSRALRMYRDIGPCAVCGNEKAERHHVDGNTANNEESNIEIVCRKCHMEKDGRLASAISRIKRVQPEGIAARWGK